MNLFHNISSRFIRLAALLAVVLLCACCTKEAGLAGPDQVDGVVNANLRLLFAVPDDTKAAATVQDYDDPDNNEGMDNAIVPSDLSVYFFDTAGKFVYSVVGPMKMDLSLVSDGSYDPHYHLYSADMYVEGLVKDKLYRVVVVANQRNFQNNTLPFCVAPGALDNWLGAEGSTDEEKLYNSLHFNFSSTGERGAFDYARLNYEMASDVRVPMWGYNTLELKLSLMEDDYTKPADLVSSGTIELLRSIAKVRIDINPAILDYVKITDFDSATRSGGVRLYSPMEGGYMTPGYSHVKSLDQTPNVLNRDKVGGVATGKYTDEWVNSGVSATGGQAVYPFFKASNGSYYMYLPEHKMGQAWMGIEFQYVKPAFETPVKIDKPLLFADYEAATAKRDETLGVLGDVPLTDEQLQDFLFPVIRNHYYVYKVVKIDPIEIQYEVCKWGEKETTIEFN